MDKLSFLEELQIMVSTGEIKPLEGTEIAIHILEDFRSMVIQELRQEIIRDITDAGTGYYAPEFDSWQDFLAYCNGYADYEKVLRTQFTNEELEDMWQSSHISEELSEKEIKQEIILQIGQLKMLDIVNRIATPINAAKSQRIKECVKARLLGLYNILYESSDGRS